MHLETVAPHDRTRLLEVAVATGLFSADDAERLLGGVLDALFADALPAGSAALACRATPTAAPAGWTYFAPDAHAEGVWNVWWLGVEPAAHGIGAGVALLRRAEDHAATDGGRLMVIETSGLESQARARRFYAREGYTEAGRIPDFYGAGDDKIIFFKHLRRG
jgi:ribosomal protein S18 acetylase RimI-like enzyme